MKKDIELVAKIMVHNKENKLFKIMDYNDNRKLNHL